MKYLYWLLILILIGCGSSATAPEDEPESDGTVIVYQPNGGEIYSLGDTVTIISNQRALATNTYFTSDKYNEWIEIYPYTPHVADTIIYWAIPDTFTPSNKCKIRIKIHIEDSLNKYDESDNYFSIVTP